MSPKKTYPLDQPITPDAPPPKIPRWRTWDASHGSYLAGRAAIDGADYLAVEMDRKWGVDRLRLLVSTELREKFDRQRYLFGQAIQTGELEAVIEQSQRMVNAWMALDRAAEAAGSAKLDPLVWEAPLGDGTVAALVRSNEDAAHVISEGRGVTVYTLAEIGRLLSALPTVAKVKDYYPGAKIVRAGPHIDDPLDAIRDPEGFDTEMDLNDEVGL